MNVLPRSKNPPPKNRKPHYDYIIVLTKRIKAHRIHLRLILYFINYLQERGIEVDKIQSITTDEIYVRLRLSKVALKHYAKVYRIDISNPGHCDIPHSGLTINKWLTPLSNKDLYKRIRGRVSSSERIVIANSILNDARYSESKEERGIQKLIKMGVIKMAFPLHDGDYHFAIEEDDSKLNDRQLLLKYWANFSYWYKKQPLNLIEKYFGSEVAFYFAWLGLYNQMLIPASFVGLCCFTYSIFQLSLGDNVNIEEVCHSSLQICQSCDAGKDGLCILREIKNTCFYTKLTFLFDNDSTVVFSVFMSLWSILFLIMWKRRESELKLRWNVDHVEADTRLRAEYKNKATSTRRSSLTGAIQLRIPMRARILNWTITYGTCFILFAAMYLVLLCLIVCRILLNNAINNAYESSGQILATYDLQLFSVMIFICVVQVIITKLFATFFLPLSIWLTSIENPRTQTEFDSAVIHKRFFLGVINNFMPLFYIAFMMDRVWSPMLENDERLRMSRFLARDDCFPSTCLAVLCIQLLFYMLLKSLLGNIFTLIIPKISKFFKSKKRQQKFGKDLPQYELDRELYESGECLVTTEFMEMVIQYGFVTLYVAAFPLAPLCALINNAMELRSDAYKFVTRQRRPVPKRQSGIGTWNNILRTITYASTATNAFVLAFTSDFMNRQVYVWSNGSYIGYLNSTLSVWNHLNKNYSQNVAEDNVKSYAHDKGVCFYKGMRYGPKAKRAYELTDQYFFIEGMKLLLVVVFEHVVILVKVCVYGYISDVPQLVKQKIFHEAKLERDLQIQKLQAQTTSKLPQKSSASIIKWNKH